MPFQHRSDISLRARVALTATATTLLLAMPVLAAPVASAKLKLGGAYFSKQAKSGFGGIYINEHGKVSGGTIARRFVNSKGKTCKIGSIQNKNVSYVQFTIKKPVSVTSSGAFSFKGKSTDPMAPGKVSGSGVFVSSKKAHLKLRAKTTKGCKARFTTKSATLQHGG